MKQFLHESFRHGDWATRKLIDACRGVSNDQLQQPGPSYGSVVATLDHLVRADASYVGILDGERPEWDSGNGQTEDLDTLATRAKETLARWERLLESSPDAERKVLLDKGTYECTASIVMAQALHHATAHREQVRARLQEFGVRDLDLQPWEYGLDCGRASWQTDPADA